MSCPVKSVNLLNTVNNSSLMKYKFYKYLEVFMNYLDPRIQPVEAPMSSWVY